MLLDSNTLECLHYEYIRAGETRLALPREKIGNRADLDIRIDLVDCSIDVCSVDVPALFSENFDYQDLRADFVHGVLTSDILGKTIYVHIPQKGYAARVKDTRSYAAIRYEARVVDVVASANATSACQSRCFVSSHLPSGSR